MQALILRVWAPQVGAAAASLAVRVAQCESGLRADAYNPTPVVSGGRVLHAQGLFQILGGSFDPLQNTLSALSMYEARRWDPWAASASCWG